MKHMIVAVLGGVVGVLALSSCTGPQIKMGEQKIVERMPSQEPDWKMKSEFEDKDHLYFQGVVTTVSDMALGLRQARAEGEKKVAERIKSKIRTEFGNAIEGQNLENGLGEYVKDVIAKVSENVEISGISQKEQYIEKIQESTGYGVKYLYNAYVLLELPRTDYLEARRRVLEGTINQVHQAQNKQAEETLKEVQQRLNQ